MDKILLIVDPQVDFISGSLAVEGAKEKMDALASALQNGEIGAKSYDEVDDILSRYIPFKEYRQKHGEPLHPHDEMAESDCWSQLCARHGEDVVNKVWSRHLASEFKRKKAPIYISRELYE